MEGQLETGSVLRTSGGSRYQVRALLGAGGQGEVYEVKGADGLYALKWYYPYMASRTQKDILSRLIGKGAPSAAFLWPQDLVEGDGSSFGYIMPLREGRFHGIVDMMKRQAEPSFYTVCRAAYNLTDGYQKLHAMGYCYRDISFGNVFFDPDNGDVLICDNDNVTANGGEESTVYGTPRFMAPEIVLGKAKPSRNTDLYSLAVLLFYMFMMGHPLEGKLEAKIRCMDIHAMRQLYGEHPVFVFDPVDRSNRPVLGYQDNVRIYWDLYPKHLRELFTHAFTDGLAQPNRRVTERQWMDAFASLMNGIMHCPACGAEVFHDEAKADMHVSHTCWSCGKTVYPPFSMVVGKKRVLLSRNTEIYAHTLYDNYDMRTVVGRVVENPRNPEILGIRNESGENWTYIRADGQQVPVAVGKSAAIARNTRICFGNAVGIFE